MKFGLFAMPCGDIELQPMAFLIRFSYAGLLGGYLALAAGCASTRQYVPRPDYSRLESSAVIIELKRPSIMGAANAFEVTESGQPIGTLGPHGELTWAKPAGGLNLSVRPAMFNMGDFHDLNMVLEGSHRYTFTVAFPFWYPFSRDAIRFVRKTPFAPASQAPVYIESREREPVRPRSGKKAAPVRAPARGSTAAILTFDARAGLSADEVALLADRFAVELDRTGAYRLVPRSKMKEILEFQAFSAACSSVDCAVEAGQQLGVEYIIYGSIGRIGALFTMNVYLAGVEKGAVVAGTTVDYRGRIEGLLTEGMSLAVERLLQAVTSKASEAPR